MIIYFKKKKLKINAKKVSSLGKISGLMFKTRNTKSLIFKFNRKTNMRIHSYFVFFNFLAIWLDENDKVIEYKIVKPFTLSVRPKKSFCKLIEIPISGKNQEIIKFFVDEGKV